MSDKLKYPFNKSTTFVYIATVISIAIAFSVGLASNTDRGLLITGVVVASLGQLAELAKGTKEAKNHAWVADGLALYGAGVKFFGILMIALGAIYGFEVSAN
ncbi:hypothetical protein [Arthrobacter sp. HMWF013]|uniref:hypothetical protein n=1 Tax=Arthrobacter sp. HMWF013 TaxID=2056849 RepID=UPI000D3C9122|nr:hypothetical protein [Arthrobacter sp. HMWF013]PTT69211.1 hypothetical protein DBR22_04375 [Arthrobacter sp. HMWF013]